MRTQSKEGGIACRKGVVKSEKIHCNTNSKLFVPQKNGRLARVRGIEAVAGQALQL